MISMKRKGLKCLVSSMIAIVIALTFISFVPMASCKDAPTMSQIMGWEKILEHDSSCGPSVVYLNPKDISQVGYVHYHGSTVVQYGFKEKGKPVRVFTYKGNDRWKECTGHSHLTIDKWLNEAIEEHLTKPQDKA